MVTAQRARSSASASLIEKRWRSSSGTSTVTVDLPARCASANTHPDCLAADGLAQDRRSPGGKIRLVDVELVRVDRSLYDGFTETIGGGDEHDLVEARFGVHREHHAGCAQVAAYHPLDARRQRHMLVGEPLVHAIGDCAVVVEAGKHFLHSVKYILQPFDIKKSFLLTREGSIGQIFGRCRGADGPCRVRRIGAQRRVCGGHVPLQRRWQWHGRNPATDLGAGLGQHRHVVDVER